MAYGAYQPLNKLHGLHNLLIIPDILNRRVEIKIQEMVLVSFCHALQKEVFCISSILWNLHHILC